MEILSSQNDALGSTAGPLPGRQRQVFDILSLFQSSQMVGLFGENGSGKTTLIKRGLIPELDKGFFRNCREEMEICDNTSGYHSAGESIGWDSAIGFKSREAKTRG